MIPKAYIAISRGSLWVISFEKATAPGPTITILLGTLYVFMRICDIDLGTYVED